MSKAVSSHSSPVNIKFHFLKHKGQDVREIKRRRAAFFLR
jgi:hypothetical protein